MSRVRGGNEGGSGERRWSGRRKGKGREWRCRDGYMKEGVEGEDEVEGREEARK